MAPYAKQLKIRNDYVHVSNLQCVVPENLEKRDPEKLPKKQMSTMLLVFLKIKL